MLMKDPNVEFAGYTAPELHFANTNAAVASIHDSFRCAVHGLSDHQGTSPIRAIHECPCADA